MMNSEIVPGREREFSFGTEEFEAFRKLVKKLTGIHLSEQKRELVYGRLTRRLRALGLETFREYLQLLDEPGNEDEVVEFCNAITTNLTSFFREHHHFEFIRDNLFVPRKADPRLSRRLRIWHAGCSTGEEPYSLAITMHEAIGEDLRRWDVRLLATDLDTQVLEKARRGVYSPERFQGMRHERRTKYFEPNGTVVPELREHIVFKQLNLMDKWPMKGPFDAIFCRNVVIYFDKETQRRLFARMAELQRPGALLFLGHSESLFKVSDAYSLIGKTIYRRV